MKHIQDGYHGLSVFLGLQIDRLLSVLVIAFAIFLATYLGTF